MGFHERLIGFHGQTIEQNKGSKGGVKTKQCKVCNMIHCEDKRYCDPGERMDGAKCVSCEKFVLEDLIKGLPIYHCANFGIEDKNQSCPNIKCANCGMTSGRRKRKKD